MFGKNVIFKLNVSNIILIILSQIENDSLTHVLNDKSPKRYMLNNIKNYLIHLTINIQQETVTINNIRLPHSPRYSFIKIHNIIVKKLF